MSVAVRIFFGAHSYPPAYWQQGDRGDGGTMALMHAPRTETGTRQDSRAGPGTDPIAELVRLQDTLDLGRHRVELLEGRLIVSPAPVFLHDRAVMWLHRQFLEVCDANGWFLSARAGLDLPPTRERIEPDMQILREPDQIPDDESYLPVRHALLVAEVVSPSSVREDREVKPRSCALAGVPFYLLVDRHVEPFTVTLFSGPGKKGYSKSNPVAVGGKLRVPEPFGIALDTSGLPPPRAAANQGTAGTPKT